MERLGTDKHPSLLRKFVNHGQKCFITLAPGLSFSGKKGPHLKVTRDTQYNDIQHNDIQHNDTQHNDTQHNDIQHNDTQHNDTQHNDTQHNI